MTQLTEKKKDRSTHKTLTLKMKKELWKALRIVSAHQEMSLQSLLLKLGEEYIKKYEHQLAYQNQSPNHDPHINVL